MSRSLWIRNGRLIDPSQKLDQETDLLIIDGKVKEIGNRINVGPTLPDGSAVEVLDAKGLLVTPGWIDIHVHLREPGGTHKETIRTGTQAAAHGGFTSVACMANTKPVNDNAYITSYILQKAATDSDINVYPIGAITKGLEGEELAEIGSMCEAGIVAISDDGKTVMNAYIMRKAMDYSKRFDLTVISHCEDACLKGRGVMNEGFNSSRFGLRGIPKASEEVIVARDIQLAELTGCRLHVAHVSTARSVELIREAKKRGLRVTAEATPHHLTLTDEVVGTYDTNTKVAPPLREQVDVDALLEGFGDGTIDALASDHAPHSIEEKEVEYDHAEFGMIGLETAFPLYLRAALKKGIRMDRLIGAMTHYPASVVGIPKGTLKLGSDGDVTIFDLKAMHKVDKTKFFSKSQNTPFHGWDVQGRVMATICGGRKVYSEFAGEKR